ncbi:TetR/AcrR family transcriptional regulator [Leucobacter komagatae]|uniref:TetR/AcrR family transcriptional regulator n=1 Tax=Leucobacter komagatae TaxID=55969 RepID=UPI0005AD026C|nr:TetR/AcrR family transcriptional regulator [Leucobacter komagatae]
MSPTHSGPVRSEVARLKILEATAQRFAEVGFERLTIEGIATAAGVGKQTIYRWWKSKSAIIAECLVEGMLLKQAHPVPNRGHVAEDLANWLDDVFATLGDPDSDGLLRSLIAAAADNPEVAVRVRSSISGEDTLTGRLTAGIGEAPNLTPDAPLYEIAEALVGTIILRALARAPMTPAETRRLVDATLGTRSG